MARSNWATIAWNHEGKPIDGTMEFDHGISLELYKNWVYIRHPEAYSELAGSFTGSTIMEIQEGDFSYQSVKIKAIRYPLQQAMFVFASQGWYHNYKEKGEPYKAILGVCCYGFDSETDEWVGVSEELREAFFRWLDGFQHHYEGYRNPPRDLIELLQKDNPSYNQGTLYMMDQIFELTSPEEKLEATKEADEYASTVEGNKTGSLLGAMIANMSKGGEVEESDQEEVEENE